MSPSNKMSWVRLIERTTNTPSSELYRVEYEIASETAIPGIYISSSEAIMCAFYCPEKDKEGLYRYLLYIKDIPPIPETKTHEEVCASTNTSGYFFPGGPASELLALFSVFFRTRFYLLSHTSEELTSSSIRLKQLYPVRFHRKPRGVYQHILNSSHEQDNNWSGDLHAFLNKIETLPENKHEPFALACHNYHLAMQMIGIDYQLMYIHLVSAIECIMPDPSNLSDDTFHGITQDQVFNERGLIERGIDQKKIKQMHDEFASWFSKNRRLAARFSEFMHQHAIGCIPTVAPNAVSIGMGDLKPYLKAIYRARSEYLHKGTTMYLPPMECARIEWDRLSMCDTVHDRKKRLKNEVLPFPYFFEKLVRHVLMSYLDAETQTP